jgi:hypothetical protein
MKGAVFGILVFFVIAAIFASGLFIGKGMSIVDQVTKVASDAGSLIQGPTPTPVIISREAIVEQVQHIQRLETTVYTIERVVEASQSGRFLPDWLSGDRLLLIARGTVVAGVDLAGLTSDDVTVAADGTSAVINMPPVSILNQDTILNNVTTRVYDRQRGLLASLNPNLETDARLEADKQILLAACEDGILKQATTDAQRALQQLLSLLPIQITVKTSSVPPCPAQSS